MSEIIKQVRDYCEECQGEGHISECCSAEVDNGRCISCGRFCSKDVCHNCEGAGYLEYKVGDEVDIFVCVWSEDYLKNQLYKPKELGDTKDFTGKIIEFPDRWNVVVKVGKKKINVKLEDISVR